MANYREEIASPPSLLISAHCSTIKRKAQTFDIQELSSILDDLVRELNIPTIRLETFLNSLNKINRVLNSSFPPVLVQIPSHYFFTIVRNTTRNLLLQLSATKKLNSEEIYILRNCILLIHHFIERITDVSKVLHWLVDATFLDSLANILSRIKKVSKKKQNTQAIKQITRLLNIFCFIQERLPIDLHHSLFVHLLQPTIDCLTSSTYLKLFENFQSDAQSFSEIEKLYLIKCPYFLTTYAGPSIAKAIEQVLDVMLPRYVSILDKHIKTIKQWKRPIMRAIHNLIITIIYAEGYFGGHTKTDTFRQLIQHLLIILKESTLIERIEANSNNIETLLIDAILVVFSVLVYESNALDFIKKCKPIEIFRQLTKVSYETIALNAQMMLAYTINDRDIKKSQDDLVRLLSTTFNLLKKTINDQQQIHLSSYVKQENIERNIIQLLETLKGLSQYEQIQEQIFKQNITLFLIESYKKLNGLSRQVLLECLWKFSFNEKLAEQIREQNEFLQSLTDLPKPIQDFLPQNTLRRSNSYSSRRNSMSAAFVEATNYEIQKVADGILWKVIKEPKLREKVIKQREILDDSLSQKFKYDLMISSSIADKDIVSNIRQLLVNEGYNIWFDHNQNYGQGSKMNTIETVTETIDNSQFVIICLSDSYKRDSFCQQQAEYALYSKRELLPIIVNKGYKPDGWLIALISSNAPIDFGSSNFNSASEMLIKEIKQRQQKYSSTLSSSSMNNRNQQSGTDILRQQEVVNQSFRDTNPIIYNNIDRPQSQASIVNNTPVRSGTTSSIASDLSVSMVTQANQQQIIHSNEPIDPIVNHQQPPVQMVPKSILKMSTPTTVPVNAPINIELNRLPPSQQQQQTIPRAAQTSVTNAVASNMTLPTNVTTTSENRKEQENKPPHPISKSPIREYSSSSSSSSEDEIITITNDKQQSQGLVQNNHNVVASNTIHSTMPNANVNQQQSTLLYSTPKSTLVDVNIQQQAPNGRTNASINGGQLIQQQRVPSRANSRPTTPASTIQDKLLQRITSQTNSRSTTPAMQSNSTFLNNRDRARLPDEYTKRKTQDSSYRTLSINSWKSNDVLDYLFDLNLIPMMPLCETMSGKALLRLFRMCQRKSSRLYDQLNQELHTRFNGYNLPMGIYTQFFIEMDTLVSSTPDALPPQPDPAPKIIERVIYVPHNFTPNESMQQTPSSSVHPTNSPYISKTVTPFEPSSGVTTPRSSRRTTSQPSSHLGQPYNESVQGQTIAHDRIQYYMNSLAPLNATNQQFLQVSAIR